MGDTLRILMLNANRKGIGTYHRALNFGRQLSRFGHDVTLITVSPSSKYKPVTWRHPSGMQVIEAPCFLDTLLPWHASGPLDIVLRLTTCMSGKWDVVYAFEYQPNISLPVYLSRPIKRFKLISDWCDWHAGASYHFGGYRLAHNIDRLFEEGIRHHADHLTVINNTLRARALDIGIPESRVTLVREGVDTEYIKPVEQGLARDRLNIPRDIFLVGTIRDHVASFALLAEAVAKQIPANDIHLLFIGKPFPELVRIAEEKGIAGRLLVPGRVEDEALPYYLNACDVLALPLEDTLVNRGRWPHKLGDMIAAGKPVITSAGGEFPEMLRDRSAALVVDFSAEGFADGIRRIRENPSLAASLAESARSSALSLLDWNPIGSQLHSLVLSTARAA